VKHTKQDGPAAAAPDWGGPRMLDRLLGPGILSLAQGWRRFAAEELDDGGAGDRERRGEFNRSGWEACAARGLFRLAAPPDRGGDPEHGGDLLALTAVLEALGRACPEPSLVFSATAHIAGAVVTLGEFATAAQVERFLTPALEGRGIGAQAITEPEAGSDVSALACGAARDGDAYVINGEKLYCTGATLAGFIITYCCTAPDRGAFGQSAFIVPVPTPGLEVEPMPKLGLGGAPLGRLVFRDCRVPAALRLGDEGQGAIIFKRSITAERILMMAGVVGAMQAQLEACIRRARSRRQFGQAIGRFQSVANRLVDMQLRCETSRLLLYRAAGHRRPAREAELDAAMAKLHISEAYVASSLDAAQLFGGAGYTTADEVQRALLHAVGSRIYAGTSEVQRLIIARLLGL